MEQTRHYYAAHEKERKGVFVVERENGGEEERNGSATEGEGDEGTSHYK